MLCFTRCLENKSKQIEHNNKNQKHKLGHFLAVVVAVVAVFVVVLESWLKILIGV